jgi:hypothetical protein
MIPLISIYLKSNKDDFCKQFTLNSYQYGETTPENIEKAYETTHNDCKEGYLQTRFKYWRR